MQKFSERKIKNVSLIQETRGTEKHPPQKKTFSENRNLHTPKVDNKESTEKSP